MTPFRLKVKVTGPLNDVTENQPFLRNRKAWELQTWYTNGVEWPTLQTCAVTSKLKAVDVNSSHHLQGRGIFWHYRQHSMRRDADKHSAY